MSLSNVERRSTVVMVEPVRFFCNEATCSDNYFQQSDEHTGSNSVAKAEHDAVFRSLLSKNIFVKMYRLSEEEGLGEQREDLSKEEQMRRLALKPDAIFPNNSISFHELRHSVATSILLKAGLSKSELTPQVCVVLYPMCPGRRNEIPRSLLDRVKKASVVTVTPIYVRSPDVRSPADVGAASGEPSGAVSLSRWSLQYKPVNNLCARGSDTTPIILVDLRGFEDVEALMGRRFAEGPTCASASGSAHANGGSVWWALEGTGSLNFSADGLSVFATASQRCHPVPFHLLCDALGIPSGAGSRLLIPSAVDTEGRCVYHTNVVGWVGDGGVCGWARDALVFERSEAIPSSDLFTTVEAFNKTLNSLYPKAFTLSMGNLMNFAGNAMYLRSFDGSTAFLALSETAATSLGDTTLRAINDVLAQMSVAEVVSIKVMTAASGTVAKVLSDELFAKSLSYSKKYSNLIICPIPTIERLGGGSVRCLLAASLSLTLIGSELLKEVI